MYEWLVPPLRYIRVIVLSGVAFGVVACALALLRGNTYVARGAFIPEGVSGSASSLAGIASQIGVSLPGDDGSASVQFYAALVQSREIKRALVQTAFEKAPDGPKRSLIDIWDVSGKSAVERELRAMREVDDKMIVRGDIQTGIVSLSIKDHHPLLAESIIRRVLELVNDFNVRKRSSVARAEETFLIDRQSAAAGELRKAEDDLAAFLAANRTYASSPELTLQFARIQRRIELRQQAYLTIAQALEQAKIEAVRNTPLITVIDAPEGSAEKDGGVVTAGLMGAFAGVILGILSSYILAAFAGERDREAPGYLAYLNARKYSLLRTGLKAP